MAHSGRFLCTAALATAVLIGLAAGSWAVEHPGTWARGADMPQARGWVAGAAVDGLFYVIGGNAGSVWSMVPDVEAYDPATDTWTAKER